MLNYFRTNFSIDFHFFIHLYLLNADFLHHSHLLLSERLPLVVLATSSLHLLPIDYCCYFCTLDYLCCLLNNCSAKLLCYCAINATATTINPDVSVNQGGGVFKSVDVGDARGYEVTD